MELLASNMGKYKLKGLQVFFRWWILCNRTGYTVTDILKYSIPLDVVI